MTISKEQGKQKFFKSLEIAKNTCTWPTVLNYETPLSSGLTVHQVFTTIAAVLGTINIAIAVYLIVGHLINWCMPLEQKHQVRVIGFLIITSLTSFLSTVFYEASVFIEPAGQLYEGFAITSIFLLYLQIIMPDLHAHDSYFQKLDAKSMEEKSSTWFRIIWICVFQILPIRAMTLIAFEVLFTYSCPLSATWSKSKTGLTAVQGFSTTFAVLAVVLFERNMRKRFLKGHRSLRKLWAFKIVVILQAIQDQVFVVLAEEAVWIPPAPYQMSYNDFLHGLPQIIFMSELLGTAILFLWAYEFKKYRHEIRSGNAVSAAGPLQALVSCGNVTDIVNGILYGLGGPIWMRNRALGVDMMFTSTSRQSGDGAKVDHSTQDQVA